MRVKVVAMRRKPTPAWPGAPRSARSAEQLVGGRCEEPPGGDARVAGRAQLRVGACPAEREPGERARLAGRIPRPDVEVRLRDPRVARRGAVVGARPCALVAELEREVEVLGPDL